MDHSVAVDVAKQTDGLSKNLNPAFERNTERCRVAKWAHKVFRSTRVLPPVWYRRSANSSRRP